MSGAYDVVPGLVGVVHAHVVPLRLVVPMVPMVGAWPASALLEEVLEELVEVGLRLGVRLGLRLRLLQHTAGRQR